MAAGRKKVERAQTGVHIEKRVLKVLKAIAARKEMGWAIKWAGVAYLIYLAVHIWRSSSVADNNVTQLRERNAATRVLAGFSITMGNPKMMLFYLALLPSLVSPDRLSAPMVLSLFVAVVVVLATVFTVYVLAAEKTRRAMTSKQFVQRFNRMTAVALGGAAGWITSR